MAAQRHFAAQYFAAKRAGFLLREHRRQQEGPTEPGAGGGYEAAAGEATDAVVLAAQEAESANTSFAGPAVPQGIPPDEVERRVAEAERRGREEGQAALAEALDHAIAALDAAGRAIGEAHGDLERRWIVPLAQASLHIGSELARQTLVDASGLLRYLEAVAAAIEPDDRDPDGAAPTVTIDVRLNPEDLAVLERASVRPAAIKLIADPLVPRAGAILSSDDKVVDDRFENRVRFAKEAVLSAAADLLRETPS
jgi:flagellar biosynthesis/type III secretory pathway protein FliH